MGKVQTQSKVSKVENSFGLFCFFLDLTKLAKLRYNFYNKQAKIKPKAKLRILLAYFSFLEWAKLAVLRCNFSNNWQSSNPTYS